MNNFDLFLSENDKKKKKKKDKKVLIKSTTGIVEKIDKTLVTEDGRQMLNG